MLLSFALVQELHDTRVESAGHFKFVLYGRIGTRTHINDYDIKRKLKDLYSKEHSCFHCCNGMESVIHRAIKTYQSFLLRGTGAEYMGGNSGPSSPLALSPSSASAMGQTLSSLLLHGSTYVVGFCVCSGKLSFARRMLCGVPPGKRLQIGLQAFLRLN